MAGNDSATAEAVDRFNEAFNRHDVDAVMAAMTDDCVFENTSPPNGQRYEGQAQVRAAWEEFFAASPDRALRRRRRDRRRRPVRRAVGLHVEERRRQHELDSAAST